VIREERLDSKGKTIRLTCETCGAVEECKQIVVNGEKQRPGYIEFRRTHADCKGKGSKK